MKKFAKTFFIVFCLCLSFCVFVACTEDDESPVKTKLDSPVIESQEYTGEKLAAVIPQSDEYEVISNEGGKEAGKYDVVLALKNAEKFEWKTPDVDDPTKVTLKFEITKAHNEITDFTLVGWVYGEDVNAPEARAKFGTPTFTYSTQENGEYVDTVPEMPGTYYVKASVAGTNNYDATEKVISFNIGKARATVATLPVAVDNLIYNGEEQSLIIAGITNDGTMVYRLGEGEWKESLPLATNAGEYIVYFKATGDKNHNESAESSIIVNISKAENMLVFTLEGKELHCRDAFPADFGATVTDGVIVYTYSSDGETFYPFSEITEIEIEAGKTYYVKASVSATENYFAVEKTESVTATHAYGEITDENGVSYRECACGDKRIFSVKKPLDFVELDLEATVSADGSIVAAAGKNVSFDFSEYYDGNVSAILSLGAASLGTVEVIGGKFSYTIGTAVYGNVAFDVKFAIEKEDYSTKYEFTLNALVITKTIRTLDDLRSMKDYADSETMQGGGYYRLGANIEAGEWYNSYGAAEAARHDYRFGVAYAFAGVLDGNGYAIKKLTLAIPSGHSGFIHKIDGGTVKNIAFTDLALGSDESLVYCGNGTFENVYVKYSAVTGFASNGTGTGSNGGWASSICGPFFTYYEDNDPNYAEMNNVVVDMSEISDEAWANCKSQSVIGTLGNESLLNNVAVIGMKKDFRSGNKGKFFRNSNGYVDWTGMGGGKVPQYVYLEYSDGTVEDSERFASFPSDNWDSAFWTVDGVTIAWNVKA